MNRLALQTYSTAIGELVLGACQEELCLLAYREGARYRQVEQRVLQGCGAEVVRESTPLLEQVKCQLSEYFQGERLSFDLPLRWDGTIFQKSVWRALLAIPYGQTASYLQLAQRCHNPKAVRAVGLANAVNAISIVIPCHRIIRHNGALGGYGGGLEAKRYLLDLEKENSSSQKWVLGQ